MRAATALPSTGTISNTAWPLPKRAARCGRGKLVCHAAPSSSGVAPNKATAALFPAYRRDPELQVRYGGLQTQRVGAGSWLSLRTCHGGAL